MREMYQANIQQYISYLKNFLPKKKMVERH